nr:helix-turn-helix domain-containing protein [Pedobacter sp. ASV2]
MVAVFVFQFALLCFNCVVFSRMRNKRLEALVLLIFEAFQIVMLIFFRDEYYGKILIVDILIFRIPLLWATWTGKPISKRKSIILLLALTGFYLLRSWGLSTNSHVVVYSSNLLGLIFLTVVQVVCCFKIFLNKSFLKDEGHRIELIKYMMMFSTFRTVMLLIHYLQIFPIKVPLGFGDDLFIGLISLILLALLGRLYFVLPSMSNIVLQSESLTEENRSYKSSRLSEIDIDNIVAIVRNILTDSRCYLDSNLTLEKLSELAKIPKHHISQAINTRENINFHGLLSEYRIKYAINLLDSQKNIRIETLAYDCGFNSISSFYKNFKKINGITPAEFISRKSDNVIIDHYIILSGSKMSSSA